MIRAPKVDREAWRDQVIPEFVNVADDAAIERYQDQSINENYHQDEAQFAFFVAIGLNNGDDPELFRIKVTHACPDRLNELDTILANTR